MMKSSNNFGFSSSLFLSFFFIVASIAVYSEAASNRFAEFSKPLPGCQYQLIFQTGTDAEAGTDSKIKITIGNSDGEWAEIPDLMKGTFIPRNDPFEKGNRDFFQVRAPCINIPVCKINVTSDGSGQKPGWYLEYVRVSSFRLNIILTPVSQTDFEFNQWLAIDHPPNELTASRDVCQSSCANQVDGNQVRSGSRQGALTQLRRTPCSGL